MRRTMKGLIYYENAEIPMRRAILSSGRPVVVVCERPSGTAVQVVPRQTADRHMYRSHRSEITASLSANRFARLISQSCLGIRGAFARRMRSIVSLR